MKLVHLNLHDLLLFDYSAKALVFLPFIKDINNLFLFFSFKIQRPPL